jgi:twitching motility two-component system response regulator PilH
VDEVHRILVVDDESIIVTFLQSLLTAGASASSKENNWGGGAQGDPPPGYLIETARSGAEALQKVRALRPHLVVLDINIPGGNGFEVCQSITDDPNCKHTIVLAMTADTNPDRLRRIQEAGARECLFKPFPMREFLIKAQRYAAESFAQESLERDTAGE